MANYSMTNHNRIEKITLDEVLRLLEQKTGYRPRRAGDGYSAKCSSHDDQHPSLSVKEDTDGTILFHCFSNKCHVNEICSALGIEVSSLFPKEVALSTQVKRNKVAEYPYKNRQGRLEYWKTRYEPKDFRWARYGEKGEVIWNRNGCEKLLYLLPELMTGIEKGMPAFLVEGEKDANFLLGKGLIATTAPETSTWEDEFTHTLKEADVIILYDNDKKGLERKNLLCSALYGNVKRLRIVDLPGLEYRDKHGLDITDWLGMGNTVEQLLEIIEQTQDYVPSVITELPFNKSALKAITFEDFLILDIPERKMLLEPFLTEQGLVMLYAKRGVGKTHMALAIAYAVASGSSFLKWSAPAPRKVLYIDGEMPAGSMQGRLRKISCFVNIKPMPGYLTLITPDLQEDPLPNLSTKEGREAIEPFTQEATLVVVDNISSLCRSTVENEAESWQPIQDWALSLRKQGKAVLFVHHAGKSGQQRGSSKKEDILDVVINLKQTDDYTAEQGACFEIHFEKTRHFAGDQATAFKAQLIEAPDGSQEWKMLNVDHDPLVLEIAKMRDEGKTILEIMVKTGLTKSQVETRMKKAKQLT